METIQLYLENMFRTLPNTPEMKRMKADLFSNMEDKYQELKSSGKSENEAIGIVIAEFGNIDELINEMGIMEVEQALDSTTQTISLEEAHNYISLKKRLSKYVSAGVSIILFGVSLLLFLNELIDGGDILSSFSSNVKNIFPLLPLFLCIIVAVGIFIYSGTQEEPYQYIDKGNFTLSNTTRSILEAEYTTKHSTKSFSIILSIGIIILTPLDVLIGSMISDRAATFGVAILLLQVALGVSILIISQSAKESYKQLLKMEQYSHIQKKESRVIGAVASIVWPLTAAIFLFTGIVYHQWHINWIIFPIVGIVFGGFCAFYSTLKGNDPN